MSWVFALLGLVFGSFANVLVHRLPRRESIVWPGSRCPHCGAAIRWYDNLPLLSWMMLAGRCRHCAAAIGWRYPLLEGVMALSWGGLAWHFGMQWLLLQGLVLSFLLWTLSVIDLETGLLPDALTLPGMAAGLLLAWPTGRLQDCLLGMLAGYGLFWLIGWLYLKATGQEGMGHGDYKLLAMLGAFLGWQALPFIIFFSSLTGAVVGGLVLMRRGAGWRAELPFGPYLAAAGMIWFVWHDSLLNWYLGWMAPVP